jgi:uncharacterized protein (TIGR01777 family)
VPVKVFVTGGTGLIGRHLVTALQERADEVICVTRSAERARNLLPEAVHLVEADPDQPGSWQDEVQDCDAVINLAGESVAKGLWTDGRKRRLRQSRLHVTRNLVEAIGRSGSPSVLISASATGYYGDGGRAALDEEHEPGSGFLSRLACEWEGTALQAESASTRVVLLRIGVVLAREDGALPRLLMPFRFGVGGPLGSGRQYFPWIHVKDLVRIIVFALNTPGLSGPINAVAPDPPTQATFARAMGEVLHRPSWLPVPAFVLRILLGEKGEMLLASQRAVPRALRARGFHFDFDNLQTALDDLLTA